MASAPAQTPGPRVTLIAPDAVRAGEPVPLRLRVENTTSRPLDLYLTGRTITFDLVVTRPDGAVVWRRLERATGQQILQVKHLGPGEGFELRDTWNQRTSAGTAAAPGDYLVQGVIPTDGEPLRTEPARLRITPRQGDSRR